MLYFGHSLSHVIWFSQVMTSSGRRCTTFPWLKNQKPEADFFTFDEAKRLVAAADGEWQTMILVALRTGMRIGELLALQWQAVDLVAGRITVRRNVVWGPPQHAEVPHRGEVEISIRRSIGEHG